MRLPPDLIDAIHDAVAALRGPPTRLTKDALAEHALRAELKRLERYHGGPFPGRTAEKLRSGRPARASPQNAQWLKVIEACVKRPGQWAPLSLGPTPRPLRRQVMDSLRGVARRNPQLLRGLRLTMYVAHDGRVYVAGVRR